MPTLKNKLNQNITFTLSDNKNILLLGQQTISLTEKEIASPAVQALIAKGEVVIVLDEKKKSDDTKNQKNNQ